MRVGMGGKRTTASGRTERGKGRERGRRGSGRGRGKEIPSLPTQLHPPTYPSESIVLSPDPTLREGGVWRLLSEVLVVLSKAIRHLSCDSAFITHLSCPLWGRD